MTLGPLEFTVIGIDGNNFTGRIADEIARVVESGTVAIVDIVLITKDADGDVIVIELDNHDDPALRRIRVRCSRTGRLADPGGCGDDRSRPAGRFISPRAAVRAPWAVRLKEAMVETGGFLISRETIAPEMLEIVNAEIEAGRS